MGRFEAFDPGIKYNFILTVVFLYSFLFPILTPNCQDEGITFF